MSAKTPVPDGVRLDLKRRAIAAGGLVCQWRSSWRVISLVGENALSDLLMAAAAAQRRKAAAAVAGVTGGRDASTNKIEVS